MKVTYNWLKDFVEIGIAPKMLADKLTMAGLEVNSLLERDGDFVFEIEVTSNRPDCLSVIGIAREVAAITGKKLKNVSPIRYHVSGKNVRPAACGVRPFSIKVEDKKDCSLYSAKIIAGVKVGPSPDWLKRRLELLGCRSINNIVDISNYILFEYAEPLHVFDLDKLKPGSIIVRRGKSKEKIITLDGIERELSPDILLVADQDKAVAIAGIMGGKDTQVTEKTKNILLEAAVFNPIIIRRSRRTLGLESESAYRFERGVDPEAVEKASSRAAELMQALAGGRRVLVKSSGLFKARQKDIHLDIANLNKTLGVNIALSKVKKILDGLGFKAKIKAKNNFIVKIPSHRQDIKLEIDLIEEVARVFGYANIPKSLPSVKPQAGFFGRRDLIIFIKNILVSLGLNEVITYSLIDKELLGIFGIEKFAEAVQILNPLSREQEILRPRLTPSLIRCLAYNFNQKQEYINLFEIAKVFLESAGRLKEELVLGIALSGVKPLLLEQGMIKDGIGLLHLKGVLETLFDRLGIKNYSFNNNNGSFSIILEANQEKIGVIMRLEKNILDKLGIKNKDVFALELSLDKLCASARLEKKFIHLPKYPAINRDISFTLREDISLKDLLGAMQEKGGPLLSELKIVDYYRGKQIPLGYRGLTISCLYRSDERTLTEAEINPLHTLICGMLSERFGVKMR